MKMLALDIGDRWTGVAISDPLGIIATPFETVQSSQLKDFLTKTIQEQIITTIVAGYPKTMRGTESQQTKKVVTLVEQLKQIFDTVEWVLWDERLTSKQASRIKHAKTKDEKRESHAIAAALILSSYLEYKRVQNTV